MKLDKTQELFSWLCCSERSKRVNHGVWTWGTHRCPLLWLPQASWAHLQTSWRPVGSQWCCWAGRRVVPVGRRPQTGSQTQTEWLDEQWVWEKEKREKRKRERESERERERERESKYVVVTACWQLVHRGLQWCDLAMAWRNPEWDTGGTVGWGAAGGLRGVKGRSLHWPVTLTDADDKSVAPAKWAQCQLSVRQHR